MVSGTSGCVSLRARDSRTTLSGFASEGNPDLRRRAKTREAAARPPRRMSLTRGRPRPLFASRRDLDQLGELFLRERRIEKLELHGIADRALEVRHLVGLQCLLGLELL